MDTGFPNGKMEQLQTMISRIAADKQNDVKDLLQNAPLWLFDTMHIVHMKKNETFIQEGTPVDWVYVLVSGIVRAVDYRVMGIEYHYMYFHPITIFGSMELLSHKESFETTLVTDTPCDMLVMSSTALLDWMRNDNHALMWETGSIIGYLLNQAKSDRLFLFVQGSERLFYVLIQEYELHPEQDACTVCLPRKEWANRTGLSTKTIDRSFQNMEDQGYVKKLRHGIRFDREQYEKMKLYLSNIISEF